MIIDFFFVFPPDISFYVDGFAEQDKLSVEGQPAVFSVEHMHQLVGRKIIGKSKIRGDAGNSDTQLQKEGEREEVDYRDT